MRQSQSHRHVVMVTPYCSPTPGGVERYVESLVGELRRTPANW